MIKTFDDIIYKLLKHEGRFGAEAIYFVGEAPERSFIELLEISSDELNKYGCIIANWKNVFGEIRAYLCRLHWATGALLEFQDILDLSFKKISDTLEQKEFFFGRHHCYYEGLIYARQGILSILNINTVAALTILRPLLEQLVFSIYWELQRNEQGFDIYYKWLRTGRGKPTFRKAMEYIKSCLCLSHPVIQSNIEQTINYLGKIYTILNTYNHTPLIDESMAAKTGGRSPGHLEDWYYSIHLYNLTLRYTIFLLIYNYPMILFPIQILHKWGCNDSPIGVFVDKCSTKIVKKHLGKTVTKHLIHSFSEDPEVIEKLNYANKFPYLSDAQVWKTWDSSSLAKTDVSKPNSLNGLHALLKAHGRAMMWAFNYVGYVNEHRELTNQERELFDSIYKGI